MQSASFAPVNFTSKAIASTHAALQARDNLIANRRALEFTQPDLIGAVDRSSIDRFDWVYGRDGSLTVKSADGWWAGCSLPMRAGKQQLSTLDINGPTSCFLDPPHPAYLRIVLDKSPRSHAIVALLPNAESLVVLLSAEDLSSAIADHRVWFISGDDWAKDLRDLLQNQPGLATPTQFVRLNLPDNDRLEPIIEQSRSILTGITSERADEARRLSAAWNPTPGRKKLCVVAGRSFKLTDQAGLSLAETFGIAEEPDIVCFAGDDPLTGSTLELVRRASACDAVVTTDFARADAPDLLPPDLPWICWMTLARVPPAGGAGPNDRLLVADPQWVDQAVAAGWKRDAVLVACWPNVAVSMAGSFQKEVVLVADTSPLDPPAKLDDFSSRRLVWEAIRREIDADPWCVGIDPVAYLQDRLGRLDIQDSDLDPTLFIRGLIEPAVAQGVVRQLIADGVAVRAFGEGWKDLPEFAHIAAGPVESRQQLALAVSRSAAILDTRPLAYRDGLYSFGRPVIRSAGRTPLAVRQDVVSAFGGRLKGPDALPAMSPALVRQALWPS